MADEPAQVEELSVDDCWDLLRQAPIGRLGVWVEDHPEIFPVNFTVDRGVITFRTAPGTKLSAALADTPVAFETDGLNAATSIAWSVVVKGRAEQVTRTVDLMETAELPLTPWHSGTKGVLVRITATEISGRRFPIADPDWWRTPAPDARPTDED